MSLVGSIANGCWQVAKSHNWGNYVSLIAAVEMGGHAITNFVNSFRLPSHETKQKETLRKRTGVDLTLAAFFALFGWKTRLGGYLVMPGAIAYQITWGAKSSQAGSNPIALDRYCTTTTASVTTCLVGLSLFAIGQAAYDLVRPIVQGPVEGVRTLYHRGAAAVSSSSD